MFDHFTFVPTGNLDRDVKSGHCICNHCNQRVETGIVNLAQHWSKCFGKESWEGTLATVMDLEKCPIIAQHYGSEFIFAKHFQVEMREKYVVLGNQS